MGVGPRLGNVIFGVAGNQRILAGNTIFRVAGNQRILAGNAIFGVAGNQNFYSLLPKKNSRGEKKPMS